MFRCMPESCSLDPHLLLIVLLPCIGVPLHFGAAIEQEPDCVISEQTHEVELLHWQIFLTTVYRATARRQRQRRRSASPPGPSLASCP